MVWSVFELRGYAGEDGQTAQEDCSYSKTWRWEGGDAELLHWKAAGAPNPVA